MNRIYHILFFVSVYLSFFLISICQTFAQNSGKIYLNSLDTNAIKTTNLLCKVPGVLHGYYIVQFSALLSQDGQKRLKADGIDLLQYVPDKAWIVFIKDCRIEYLRKHGLIYIDAYTSKHRLDAGLLLSAEVQDIKVQVFDTVSAPVYFTMHTLQFEYHGNGTFHLTHVKSSDIQSIAEQEFVCFIAPAD